MNAFFELKGAILRGQKHFGVKLIERLIAEHEALRKENARLRALEIPFADTNLPAVIETGELEWLRKG